jgi:hypothetical protein
MESLLPSEICKKIGEIFKKLVKVWVEEWAPVANEISKKTGEVVSWIMESLLPSESR